MYVHSRNVCGNELSMCTFEAPAEMTKVPLVVSLLPKRKKSEDNIIEGSEPNNRIYTKDIMFKGPM